MTRMFCDRCGQRIKSNDYYRLEIFYLGSVAKQERKVYWELCEECYQKVIQPPEVLAGGHRGVCARLNEEKS